jgi:hypothetical protein
MTFFRTASLTCCGVVSRQLDKCHVGLCGQNGDGTDIGNGDGLARVAKVLKHILDQDRALGNDTV